MKSIQSKVILIIAFLTINYFGHAQLLDPFGKVITHEIKLQKLKNGMRAGAFEWTTGGKDSLQRFFVKGLDINEPVQVRILSKAPDHNIEVSFYKSNWDKVESSISTNGDKFAEKIFRTMNTAGIGIRSDVAGIPYVISVKVGLAFPSTKSLVRFTDDKEEYTQHLRKMGFTGQIFSDNDNDSSNDTNATNTNPVNGNNTLTYIIIGLLTIIIILLGFFLLKKKSAKNTTLILMLLCAGPFCIAQSSAPKLVPVDGQGDSPVFYEYQTSNVANQGSVPINTIMNSEDIPVMGSDNREVRISSNPGSVRLSPELEAKIKERIEESNREFDENYGENSPGEDTEGNQRTLPTDITNEELNRLRRQVQQLQQQVDILNQEDAEYEEQSNSGNEILVYCDDLKACRDCYLKSSRKILVIDSYFQYLQNFYASEIKDINDKIAFGNAGSNVHAVSAMVWQGVLHKKIKPAVKQLKSAYSMKFDEYIEAMRSNFEHMEQCNTTGNPDGFQTRALREQTKAKIEFYSRTKIID